LSPIAESFSNYSGAATPQALVPPSAQKRPGTPHGVTPSLEDLRRKTVKFHLADDGHSRVVNVSDCEGGIEVLERVLKKFGKSSGGVGDGDLGPGETEDGGLTLDGWGVFLDESYGEGKFLLINFFVDLD
jgi:mitogen-activated protein kinase kinase kinase